MTPQAIEAEYWAWHYEENKTGEEFDDDDEGASDAYLQQIIAEAEAAEAAAAARGEQPAESSAPVAVKPVKQPVAQVEIDPDDWGPEE
jgi:hypothetical protein